MNYKRSIAEFIRRECVEYPPKQEFLLGKLPGARYSRQYYLSRLLYNIDMGDLVAGEFHDIVAKEIGHWQFQLAGREWSAIPLMLHLQYYLSKVCFIHLNSFMVKRNRKTYGIHNYIEGRPNDLPVLIVDDVLNSTNSFLHCRDVVESEEVGLKCLPFIFAVLDKYSYKDIEEPEYFDRHLGRDYRALSIVTRDDIFHEA